MTKAEKPKLTDAERHKRFVETARKVGASEDLADFDLAFGKIVSHKKKISHQVARATRSKGGS